MRQLVEVVSMSQVAPTLPEASSARLSSNQRHAKLLQVANEFWSQQDPIKARRVPLAIVREQILLTKDADSLPNALVAQLLTHADKNRDGYLTYEEYLTFVDSATQSSRSREVLSRAALTVVPRSERSTHTRTYLQHCTCCPPALAMITFSLIEVAVFIYYAKDMGQSITTTGPAPTYSPLIYNPFRRYEAWRYVSYALIHSGYVHLTTNLAVQVVLGLLLELVHGWWRVSLIYLAGVVAGSLAQSIAGPDTYLAGASGGVYAIMYAHLGNLILNWSEMQFRWVQLVVCLVLSITDFSFALWDSFGNPNPSNTGHMAHLGGAMAGLLVGINLLRNLRVRRWERYCWWVALLLYLMLVTTGVLLNVFLPVPQYFPYSDHTNLTTVRDMYFGRY